MKNIYKITLFCVAAMGTVTTAIQPVQAQTQTKKKQTVGDLLKRVQEDSRGAKVKTMEKGATAVPDSQFNFPDQQKPTKNFSSIKPPKSSEIMKYETQGDMGQYEKTLDMQIQELYKLTKKLSGSSNRGELWLRLAELYVEKSTLIDQRKQDEYDEKLKQFQSGQSKIKPKLDLNEAREYNRKAIELYEWFLRDFPRDEKMSQALFFLGYNYFELGENKKGSFYYDELTKKFPKSPFVGEAHFALAEYYFENEKWADAYKEYSHLIKDKKHRLNTFSLYKGAWCLYRVGKTEDAIKYLDFIIKMGKSDTASQLANKKYINKSKLEGEALRDIVVFFSDLGDTKRAIDYFRSLGVNDQNSYIEKLAGYYADKGNREASREIYHSLIKQDPSAKKAFDYQYQIVQNYFYSKNSPQFKEELYNWINNFKKNSAWAEKNKSDTAFLETSYKLREQTLRNYIMQQHQTAQNSRAPYSRQTALEGYQLYFQEFSDSPQAADMHFFFAELLYDMNRYDEASQHYTWVAENAPQSKYAAKSAQNALLAIEKALPKEEDLQRRTGDSIEPIAYDPKVERFIKSATWYLQKFPRSEREADIKFRIGRLSYITNHFAEAEVQFKDIVKNYPKTQLADYSANLLLDIYNLKKDYAGLEKVGTELLANDSIAGSKTGTDIRGVLEKASFKKAQDLEIERKYLDSAVQFQSFASQNPKSELVALAFFNAGVNYERSGKNFEAIQNYKKSLEYKDKNAETIKPKSMKLLAKIYQDVGQFEESARLFQKLAQEYPQDPLVSNYLFNSAVMFEAIGKNRDAINGYNEYLKMVKPSKDNAETILTVAELLKKTNNHQLAIDKYKEYLDLSSDMPRKVEVLYHIVLLNRLLEKDSIAQEFKIKTFQTFNQLPGSKKADSAKYVAKLKYEDAVKVYDELKEIKIPSDPTKQKQVVDKKLELVTRLNDELAIVIKLDSAEEIISALNLLGETNEHMSQSILDTPLPKGLSEESKKQYQAGVQKIAEPFQKKAIESYKLAVERAWDLEVYSGAYQHALSKMSEQNPKTYYNGGEIGFDSRLIHWLGDK